MRSIRSITGLGVTLGVLALAGIAAAATTPTLALKETTAKVANGRIVLTVTCASDNVCNSIVGARVPMPGGVIVKKGGLGSKIFKLQADETKALVFTVPADVRRWLKTHRRTNLYLFMKAVDEDYDNNWKRELRIPLRA
jgi:hypothetical protein